MPAFLVFVAIAFGLADAAKLPKGWKSCRQDEHLNDCLKDAIQSVVPFLVEGVPSLGVNSIDPLHIERLSISRGQNQAVNLDLEFKDLDIAGIKDVQVTSVDMDLHAGTMKLEVVIPKLKVTGKSLVEGKVLVLPVHGDGDCDIELDNVRGHLTFILGGKSAGSKKYYNIEDLEFTFDCDLMKLKFDNLFNGDKALGDQLNIFLNENWKDLLSELGPPIAKSLGQAFTEIGNRVFSKIPKDQITPP